MSTKPCKTCGSTERYKAKGRTGKCKVCHNSNRDALKYYYLSRDKNMLDYEWRLNKLLGMAKSRASRKNREFNISTEYLVELWHQQAGRCAISGVPLELNYATDGGPHHNGPSLDRIDSSKGYIIGNVRLVTYHVNIALSCFGEDKLIELAEQIVKYQRSIN